MAIQRKTIEQIEQSLRENNDALEKATFGMGCFWSPDSRFGSLPGVIRTRVGFAGGTTDHPTYRNMGDHTEVVEIDFNPLIISYDQILIEFWNNHYPNRDEYKGKQYISLLLYHSKSQLKSIFNVKSLMEERLGEAIETEIQPIQIFTEAENRHQKYYLKRYPKALEQLVELYPIESLFTHSTFAARLNGFVKGFGSKLDFINELKTWEVPLENRDVLIDCVQSMKW